MNNINKIIDKYLKKNSINYLRIIEIEDLGEVSKVFKIETTTKNLVLKINFKDSYEIFQKEKWCSEEALKIGIKTAKIHNLEIFENYSFLLMDFVDGINCSQIIDKGLKKEAIKNLAHYSSKLAQIKPNNTIADLKNVDKAKSWFQKEYLEFEINLTSSMNDYLLLDNQSREFVLDSLSYLQKIDFEFVLCHGDLSLKNCIYNQENNTFYLLDFGSAETHLKNYFEIMLKWVESYYDKTMSEDDYILFVKEATNQASYNWLDENLQIIKKLALLYCLDKYRYAHDRNKSLEKDYEERFRVVLNLIKLFHGSETNRKSS